MCRPSRLLCPDPLAYTDCLALMSMARLVRTDRGGVQDETTMLRIPCLTLRETTERQVTVTHGTNRVIGTDPGRIASEVRHVLDRSRPTTPPSLWDGRASCRIVEILLSRQSPADGPSRLAGGVQHGKG